MKHHQRVKPLRCCGSGHAGDRDQRDPRDGARPSGPHEGIDSVGTQGQVLDQNQELRFRVSLARSSLLVDSTPTKDSVTKYATHLMAELEQIAYAERKGNTKKEPHRLKKIEEDAKGLGKGGDRRPKEGEEAERPKPVCKFFNTEHGCRKGRQCKWLHQPDDKRRCYTCGSTNQRQLIHLHAPRHFEKAQKYLLLAALRREVLQAKMLMRALRHREVRDPSRISLRKLRRC